METAVPPRARLLAVAGSCALLAGCFMPPAGSPLDAAVAPPPDLTPAEPTPDPAAPFALLELFTSEGCNSCPPADAALNEVALAEQESGRRVIVVAWHVDYWDYLGWVDPYASPDATARQRDYARVWNAKQIYTPGIVIQGREHRAGVAPATVESKIGSALGQPVDVSTTVWTRDPAASPLVVEVRVDGAPEDGEVTVVLVERGLVQRPSRGENRNVLLSHENVARAWATTAPGRTSVSLDVPADVVRANASLVAIVQPGPGLAPVGATRIDLLPAR